MTINQKIKKLEALKALLRDLDEREKSFMESIKYYEERLEDGEDKIDEDDYRMKEIKESRDAIDAIEILRKELEKLA